LADHFQLLKYEVKDAGGGNIVILVSGPRNYYSILRHAFNNHHFSRAFDDRKNRYTWGAYINDIQMEDRLKVMKLLELLTKSVCIDDALSQTFALSYHYKSTFEGTGRTDIGKLVYSAKPYHRPTSPKQMASAVALADHLEQFILSHPSYMRSDFLIAVPSSPNKSFDLPTFLARHLSNKLNIKNGQQHITRVGQSKPMKDYKSVQEKSDNIRGAFQVINTKIFEGSLVTVIDDIYESGTTLHELALTLQNAGATVQGLVATKTLSDPS
jgi:hypothetical protein